MQVYDVLIAFSVLSLLPFTVLAAVGLKLLPGSQAGNGSP